MGTSRYLVLTAMIFAVAMTFIDQTIVALAIPDLQRDLGLSATGAQWIINGYLLALSALFALGGKLADVVGHRRMVLVGIVVFAARSALCGATPTGAAARGVDDHRSASCRARARRCMFPAALAIVVDAFPVRERGRALAIFFGDHRRPDLHRPDRRRLPDRVDLARDLLDQRPGRDRRARPDPGRRSPTTRRHPAPHRLPRRRARLRRDGPRRARPAAVERLGLERRRDLGLHRRRPRAARAPSSASSCARPSR